MRGDPKERVATWNWKCPSCRTPDVTRQVVAVSGPNPTARKFVASGSYTAGPSPAPEPVKPKHELTLVTACGPFTTSEDLLYNPPREVTRLKPQLLLLIGPFIDTKIIENELAETYR